VFDKKTKKLKKRNCEGRWNLLPRKTRKARKNENWRITEFSPYCPLLSETAFSETVAAEGNCSANPEIELLGVEQFVETLLLIVDGKDESAAMIGIFTGKYRLAAPSVR
jgi:hypothetical protein